MRLPTRCSGGSLPVDGPPVTVTSRGHHRGRRRARAATRVRAVHRRSGRLRRDAEPRRPGPTGSWRSREATASPPARRPHVCSRTGSRSSTCWRGRWRGCRSWPRRGPGPGLALRGRQQPQDRRPRSLLLLCAPRPCGCCSSTTSSRRCTWTTSDRATSGTCGRGRNAEPVDNRREPRDAGSAPHRTQGAARSPGFVHGTWRPVPRGTG
jgi:hypothetical protein